MKRIKTFFLVMSLFVGILQAQTTFDGVLYDFELPQDNGWGIHGVTVAPDGNLWLALHGDLAQDTLFTAEGDTVNYRPIYILDPNTGDHVSFSPLRVLEMPDGGMDTLHAGSDHNGSGKGIGVDNDGNILFTSWTTVYRIDYTNGKVLNRFIPENLGSMTEAVQSSDGNIFVGYVGKNTPIYLLDNDFVLIGEAVDTNRHINRTMEISDDGKDLYTGSTWNGLGIVRYHSDIPGLQPFEAVDTLGNWTNVAGKTAEGADTVYSEVKLWASSIDFAPDGSLWAGNLRDDWSGPGGKGSMWYAFDVSTGKIIDSLGIPLGDSSAGGVYSPRGAAWSNDGTKMYLADYDYNTITVWNYTAPVSVEEIPGTIPSEFALTQNYPNPFNPTTTISFTMPEANVVSLKVFNMLGQEVATIINEQKAAGAYKATFDASNIASGTYVYTLKVGSFVESKKMILLK